MARESAGVTTTATFYTYAWMGYQRWPSNSLPVQGQRLAVPELLGMSACSIQYVRVQWEFADQEFLRAYAKSSRSSPWRRTHCCWVLWPVPPGV